MKKILYFTAILTLLSGMSFSCKPEIPAAETLDAPAELKATNITTTTALLSWTGPAGAEKYNLKVGNFASVEVQGTSYRAAGLTPETTYKWQVQSIKGTLASEWTMAEFKTIKDDEPDDMVAMSVVDITYDNKNGIHKKFNYLMKFSAAESGAEVQFELNTDFTDYYLKFADKSYGLASGPEETGIIPCEANWFVTAQGQEQKSISAAEVTIAAEGGAYNVNGCFESADGSKIKMTYKGELPIEKANLLLTTGLIDLGGLHGHFASFGYYIMPESDYDEEMKEGMGFDIEAPTTKYYDYLPLPVHEYVCSEEQVPWKICIDPSNADNVIFFHFIDGEKVKEGTYHNILGGRMQIESMSKGKGHNWTTVAKGEFKTEVTRYRYKDPETEKLGKKMTFNITINGELTNDPNTNKYYWVNPLTKGVSKNVNRTDFTHGTIYYDEEGWGNFGLTESNPCVDICLATEGAKYYEWHDDVCEPSHYFVRIILYVDPSNFAVNVVPEGSWTLDWEWSGKAGTFMPGNLVQGINNIPDGGYYFCGAYDRDDDGKFDVQAPFGHGRDKPGTITIAKNEDGTYTVTGDVYDDRGLRSKNIKFSYTGELPNEDDVESLSACQGNSSKFKSGAKGVFNHRLTKNRLAAKPSTRRK